MEYSPAPRTLSFFGTWDTISPFSMAKSLLFMRMFPGNLKRCRRCLHLHHVTCSFHTFLSIFVHQTEKCVAVTISLLREASLLQHGVNSPLSRCTDEGCSPKQGRGILLLASLVSLVCLRHVLLLCVSKHRA